MASKDKKPEDKLDDVIKEKFLCKQRFTQEVEELVKISFNFSSL